MNAIAWLLDPAVSYVHTESLIMQSGIPVNALHKMMPCVISSAKQYPGTGFWFLAPWRFRNAPGVFFARLES